MIDAVRRLSRGYRLLIGGTLRFFFAVAVLAAVSVGISLPLWFVAHRFPRWFDLAILTVALVALLLVVVRKIRRPSFPHRSTDTFSPLSRGVIGIAILGSVISMVIGYGAFGIAGMVAVSGYVAWRIVPR